MSAEVMGTLQAESPLAYLLDLGGGEEHWIPKSQATLLSGDPEKGRGEELVMEIPDWLARKLGVE